ncbi:hypothetical protein [Embleya sp. NPDC001921]
MDSTLSAAVVVAYDFVPSADVGALVRRLRAETIAMLRYAARLPPRLVRYVLATDDRELRAALAANVGGRCGTMPWRAMLARVGDPTLAMALYTADPALDDNEATRTAVWAAADPADVGWRDPGGLVELLTRTVPPVAPSLLRPALRAPFPEVMIAALVALAPSMTPRHVTRVCRHLVDVGGRTALAEAVARLSAAGELHQPDLLGLLRDALDASEPARIPAVEVSSTDEALLQVRLQRGRAFEVAVTDWESVRAEQARRPFDNRDWCVLVRWPDCPDDLVLAALRNNPYDVANNAARIPFDALSEPCLIADGKLLERLLRRGITERWWSPERVLDEVTPARRALAAIPDDDPAVDALLTRLVEPLGAEPALWLSLYRSLQRFPGTVLDLIETDCRQADRTRPAAWSSPLAPLFPGRAPEGSRAVLLRLLRCAPEEATRAMIPVLDPRGVQQLLLYGRLTPRLRDHVYAVRGSAAQAAHASRWDLSAEDLANLSDLDDPEVNANLFLFTLIDRAERARVLAGVGRSGNPVAISERLITAVRGDTSVDRESVTAGIASGDPRVVRAVLARIRIHSENGRLRLLVALWERHGPVAVRELLDETHFEGRRGAKHPLPAGTRRIASAALESSDGLDELRSRLAGLDSPEAIVALLRRYTGKGEEPIRHLRAEGGTLSWPELSAAHRTEPFHRDILYTLVGQPDCPRALLLVGLASLRLLSPDGDVQDWLARALDRGVITPEDVVRVGNPARDALDVLGRRRRRDSTTWRPPVRFLARLLRGHLGSDPQAWTVALHLFADFTGTVPELLATAGAVAR